MKKFELGKVVKLHGVKGQMKISTKFDKDFDLSILTKLYNEAEEDFEVKRIFQKPDGVVVELDGIDLEKAKTYIGKRFYVDAELFKDKILIEELKGSAVFVDEKIIGKVFDVGDYGAAEVIFIKDENGKEIIFPNVKGVIENFDKDKRELKLNKSKLQEVSDYEDWYFNPFSRNV